MCQAACGDVVAIHHPLYGIAPTRHSHHSCQHRLRGTTCIQGITVGHQLTLSCRMSDKGLGRCLPADDGASKVDRHPLDASSTRASAIGNVWEDFEELDATRNFQLIALPPDLFRCFTFVSKTAGISPHVGHHIHPNFNGLCRIFRCKPAYSRNSNWDVRPSSGVQPE